MLHREVDGQSSSSPVLYHQAKIGVAKDCDRQARQPHGMSRLGMCSLRVDGTSKQTLERGLIASYRKGWGRKKIGPRSETS